MIEDTIAEIEARIRSSESLDPEKRRNLEALLADLRAQAESLPAGGLQPRAIRGASLSDAAGPMERLQESLSGFEATHPELIGVVNRLSVMLSNMGI